MDCRLSRIAFFFFFPGLKVNTLFFRSLLSDLYKPVRNNPGWWACARDRFQPSSVGENHLGAVWNARRSGPRKEGRDREKQDVEMMRASGAAGHLQRPPVLYLRPLLFPLKSCLLMESPQIAKYCLCFSIASFYQEKKKFLCGSSHLSFKRGRVWFLMKVA